MKKVFLLILYFNGFEDLRLCLPTLKNFRQKNYSLHTIVINNGSNDLESSKLKALLKNYKEIKLLVNKGNLGFAKGNNAGIKYALKSGADYVVLLNNDTKVEDDFIGRGIILNADIISPVVKFREFKDKPKMIYDLGGKVNWWTGRTSHINAYREDFHKRRSDSPLEVDYVAGCSMMISRNVLDSVGLLDESYFIYFEDVDYCIKAKKKGFKVLVDPGAVIYHKLGGSMDRWSARAIYRNLLSNFIFISKHLGIRTVTGYAYLALLTAKIIRDSMSAYFKGNKFRIFRKKWRGARNTYSDR